MKIQTRRTARLISISLMATGFAAGSLFGQQTRTTAAVEEDEPIELSPFEVDASADEGYRASNAISGTRLNTRIKDLPMPLEVITEEFIDDVGAADLRESLSYSAGVILQSQNDAGSQNTYVGAGGVHNPEGATSNKTQTSIKMRGYITDSVLRDGYLRQNATDSINIGRVEVVRGPAALLYGIGNFGGIINYVPKSPMEEITQHEVTFSVGTDDFYRATIDTTGPLSDKLAYRLTGAWQDTGDWTDFNDQSHYFISPVLTFRPFDKTKILLDLEYGEMSQDGIGFQSVRARADVDPNQQDRLERAGFVEFPDKDLRTFRWSGPDTFRDTTAWNARIELQQNIFEGLNFLAGYNKSEAQFEGLDVGGALQQGIGPESQWGTVTLRPHDALNGDADIGFEFGEINNAIFDYRWSSFDETTERDQFRAELSYSRGLFEDSELLSSTHSVMAGYSYQKADRTTSGTATAQDQHNWRNPADSSYIRFGVQGDGSPDAPMTPTSLNESSALNEGLYFVYQGRFWEDRINLVGGIRNDKNDIRVRTTDYRNNNNVNLNDPASQSQDTAQWGVSFAPIPQVSIFYLESEGLQPNFDGNRDLMGNPIKALTAKSKEIGVKVDLIEGKLSGTISSYKIDRTGTSIFYWWAPSPAKGRFDPTKDIIYSVNENPLTADWSPPQVAARAEWDAAVASGAAYQKTEADGASNWYVNASTPQGAAYMDKVYAGVAAGGGWPGWFFNRYAPDVNNATLDWASGEDAGFNGFAVGDDKSEGIDVQLLFTPTPNMQLLLTYAHTEREVVNAGAFPTYPYPEDRWAVWYFPDGAWGLTGYPLNEAYADPSDTGTWQGLGYGAGERQDDTPENAVSFWGSYRFTEGRLAGLSFGLGGQWESEREYFSGITDGAGQLVTDENGDRVILSTDPRLNIDAMARYEFSLSDNRNAWVQLNINNLLNDEDLYGYIYAPGISARLQFGLTF